MNDPRILTLLFVLAQVLCRAASVPENRLEQSYAHHSEAGTQGVFQQSEYGKQSITQDGVMCKIQLYLDVFNADWDLDQLVTHPAFEDYQLRITEPRLCDPTVKQYSGYLDITNGKHLFFW